MNIHSLITKMEVSCKDVHMNKPILQTISSPKAPQFYQVEKWIIGLKMAVMAYLQEIYVSRSVKRDDSKDPDTTDVLPRNFSVHLFVSRSINRLRITSFISCLAAARTRSLCFVSDNSQS